MNYLMLVCNDGTEASAPEEQLVADAMEPYIAETAGVSLYGHPLQRPDTATTVRVRDGRLLASDGPFIETKEYIAGFDLLDCDSRDQAIRAAASHPLSWFNKIEVRPLVDDDGWSPEVVERLEEGPAAGRERYMLLIWSDGVATEEKRETMQRELPGWIERMTASPTLVAGCQLAHPDKAATVRVRGPHTLVTDEPFADSEEFLAGINVIDCSGRGEAIAAAAAHPVSWFHAIEVRPFTPAMCGQEPSGDSAVADARVSTVA